MGRPSKLAASITKMIDAEYAAEARERQRLTAIADRGPPAGSPITAENWRYWHQYGFVSCPANGGRYSCHEDACGMGHTCPIMAAKGMTGDGQPLPWAQRPLCQAKTRASGACKRKVEPGMHRCRLHGGASTGPKTPEGKARNAAATRARWERFRAERGS